MNTCYTSLLFKKLSYPLCLHYVYYRTTYWLQGSSVTVKSKKNVKKTYDEKDLLFGSADVKTIRKISLPKYHSQQYAKLHKDL